MRLSFLISAVDGMNDDLQDAHVTGQVTGPVNILLVVVVACCRFPIMSLQFYFYGCLYRC